MAYKNFMVDDRQLQKFANDMKIKRPSQVGAIVRTVLNDQSTATRKQAINNVIPKTFNLRSKWIQSSILTDFAKGRNTATMRSVVGAASKWAKNPSNPFMGMRQQEFGEDKKNPDINTITSRGGSFSKRVRPSWRLNKIGQFVKIKSSNTSYIKNELRKLESENFKGGIRIQNAPGFKSGIYKFISRKKVIKGGKKVKQIQMVQDLSKQMAKIKKRIWLQKSVDLAVNENTTGRFFQRAFNRFVS